MTNVIGWVFVHGSDPLYRKANPEMVDDRGLSIDATEAVLESARKDDDRISVVTCQSVDPGRGPQNKCWLRNQYMEQIERLRLNPDYMIVLDDDEFYTEDDLARIMDLIHSPSARKYHSFLFRQRHIWYPPSRHPGPGSHITFCRAVMFDYEVVGAYWHVPHMRVYRWTHGMRYLANHNEPCLPDGRSTHQYMLRFDDDECWPECIHLGFAKPLNVRGATNHYYVARGEGKEKGGINRQMYVDCRAAWAQWRQEDQLPHGARVIPYIGPVPECFT